MNRTHQKIKTKYDLQQCQEPSLKPVHDIGDGLWLGTLWQTHFQNMQKFYLKSQMELSISVTKNVMISHI